MSTIKYSRAKKQSKLGDYPRSFDAMWDTLPTNVINKLSSQLLAELLDSNWEMSQKSKDIALSDAVNEGGIWDERTGKMHDLW